MNKRGMKKECTNPDALSLWELEAFADGENMPHIAAHIQSCGHCQAEVALIRVTTATLRSELYRFDCPPAATLRSFFWRELDGSASAVLTNHLHACVDCSQEMAALGAFIGSEQAVGSEAVESKIALKETISALPSQLRQQYYALMEQARVVVATLVPPVNPQFAGAALRSDASMEQLSDKQSYLFEAQGYDVSLIIQSNPDGSRRLSGQALSIEAAEPISYQLMLLQTPDATINGPMDNAGSFSVPSIAAGEYQLIMKMAGTSVVVPSVTIT